MTAYFSKLNISRRLGILGIIAAVLMAIPTAFYVSSSWQNYSKAQQEQLGLLPAEALLEVIRLTQQHRGLTAVWLSGNASVADKRLAKQQAVESSMQRLAVMVDEHVSGSKAIADWRKAVADWKRIGTGLAQGGLDKQQSFAAHNRLINDILNAGDRFNDEFALSHDSDSGFSHLAQTVLYLTPQITDTMGKLRAVGASVLSAQTLQVSDRVVLASLLTLARSSIDDAAREAELLFDARPELRQLLASSIQTAIDDARSAMRLTESEVLSKDSFSHPAIDYFEQYTKAIDAQFAVAQRGFTGMRQILNDRVTESHNTLVSLVIMLSLVASFGLWLGYIIAQSITRQLGGEVHYVVSIVRAVARGELTTEINTDRAHENSLLVAMSEMQSSLRDLVTEVRDGSESILSGSAEISASNQDLSRRTEQHAGELEETASSIVQISTAVKQNTQAVVEAKAMAESANSAALEGGAVVQQVQQTMRTIEESAKKIHNIIGVVDEIAFQTNILALNAAVEAARAGEQGRGFAVVATEVRSLAQRSAEAAQQVRSLIVESVENVSIGSTLAGKANVSTEAIVTQVKTVSELLVDIANASREQAKGIEQIDQSMSSIDKATQQNTAMVEESAASAETLRQEAEKLSSLVSVFKLEASPARAS